MASSNLKVYLDHHIPRDSLLYKRAATPDQERSGDEAWLKIEHLGDGDASRAHLLRKPDFQRATWAWTPEDCASLLESVLTEQVVPSVIMWLSPESHWYVLDGGHRVSVLLAWIKDDWGDRLPPDAYKDASLEINAKLAGKRVRELLRQKGIGEYREYINANRRYKDVMTSRNTTLFGSEMTSEEQRYANLVRRWQSVNMGFPILWVKGDYEKAEQSFLRINKTGRTLSPWETTLVENRRSSFARAVMSVARVADKFHCWPIDAPEVLNDKHSQKELNEILDLVPQVHDLLFLPVYQTPIDRPQQPVLATPYTRPELQPAYLAEVLTITEGNKGQTPETRKLLQRDAKEPIPVMITNGRRLLANAKDVIENITGRSPRSLDLQPLVYFYNSTGTYVRSLFYGMIYWLNRGSSDDIMDRKYLFTIHRAAFETMILQNKDRIITRIGRRIGSGAEVTYPTAMYYDGLLKLLIEHGDQIESPAFVAAHERLIETLSAEEASAEQPEPVSSSRTYRGRMRTGVQVQNFLKMFPQCPICGGRFYPGKDTQIDHKLEYHRGGETKPSNAQEAHNFCNWRRAEIEEIQSGKRPVSLPTFEDPTKLPKMEQLSFLFSFEEESAEAVGEFAERIEGENSPDDDDSLGLEDSNPEDS